MLPIVLIGLADGLLLRYEAYLVYAFVLELGLVWSCIGIDDGRNGRRFCEESCTPFDLARFTVSFWCHCEDGVKRGRCGLLRLRLGGKSVGWFWAGELLEMGRCGEYVITQRKALELRVSWQENSECCLKGLLCCQKLSTLWNGICTSNSLKMDW